MERISKRICVKGKLICELIPHSSILVLASATFSLGFQFSTLTINVSWNLNILNIMRQDCLYYSYLCLPWHHPHRAGGPLTAREIHWLPLIHSWCLGHCLLLWSDNGNLAFLISLAEGEMPAQVWQKCSCPTGPTQGKLWTMTRSNEGQDSPVGLVDGLEARCPYIGRSERPGFTVSTAAMCQTTTSPWFTAIAGMIARQPVFLNWLAMFHWRNRRALSKFPNSSIPFPNVCFFSPSYSLFVCFPMPSVDMAASLSEDRNEPFHHVICLPCPMQKFLILYFFQINNLIYTFTIFLI